ncbi:MAG: hypothetical protein AB7G17_03555 [Phycisphaerales bacterium]
MITRTSSLLRGAAATLACSVCAFAPLTSCAPSRPKASSLFNESFANALAPASYIEFATPGRALVVALAPPTQPTDSPPTVNATIDGAQPIPSVVYRLTPPLPDADPWLGPVGAWFAQPANTPITDTSTSSDVWVAVLVLPPDAQPRTVTVNARIIQLRWLDTPEDRTSAPRAAAPLPQSLSRFLTNVRLDPAHRWRDRLLRERLDAPPAREPALAHPALELLAVQTEDRWRAGLRRFRTLADPSLAATLTRTLTAIVVSDDATVFPVWPTDPTANASLLAALLDESLDTTALESRVRAYLAAFPPATAWVEDDAGRGAGIAVSLADLMGASTAAALTWRDAPDAPPEMNALPAFSVRTLTISPAATTIDARLGSWTTTLPTLAQLVPAKPPGVTLGPLRAGHTLESWRAGVDLAAPSPAVALLRPALYATGWELFLQCAGAPSSDEFIRVYLGPTDSPTHIFRVKPDGSLVNERSPLRASTVLTASTPDGWSATLPIPTELTSDSAPPLRIAIERVDAQRRRSTWPRPLLPWRTIPGRAAIDLSAWSGP